MKRPAPWLALAPFGVLVDTLVVWMRLSAHAFKLTSRALGRSWPWLLVAPALSLLLELVSVPVMAMGGMVGGFIVGALYAAALSVALYVGRGIIEQRRMELAELVPGMWSFIGEVMNVLFVLWIASLVLGYLAPPLLLVLGLAVVVVPLLETVALEATSGFGAFEVAWSFFRRDFAPWLFGQLPLVVLLGLGSVAVTLGLQTLTVSAPGYWLRYAAIGASALRRLVLFAAFIYRGVLFLTLDNTRPHARAARFGPKSRRVA